MILLPAGRRPRQVMMQYENDTIWLAALKKGDPVAETQLFQRFFRSMCLLAERITGEKAAAEDIVAEAFIKTFKRIGEFSDIGRIKAYLYISVRNSSYTYTTTQKRHHRAHLQLAATMPASDEGMGSAEDLELLRVQLLEEIYQEIENLPDQCRRISKMIFWEGKSTEQIARELDISPQTVRTQKARAIQLLRQQLFKDEKFNALLSLGILVRAFWDSW